MEDWDAPPKPKPGRPPRTLTRGDRVTIGSIIGVLVVVGALTLGVAMRFARPEAGPETVDMAEALGELTGNGLDVANADPTRLQPGDALVLRNRNTRVEVVPGPLAIGKAGCATRPHASVELTVTGEGTPVTLDPALFRLDTNGLQMPVIAACSSAPATIGDGDRVTLRLVYEAKSGRRLVYGPRPDITLAAWHVG